ncbi:microcin C transport system substrate-binding protein [Neorhizobium sp. R1-B]|uniref:extracellular solute-binding protein n=1 Tax=Neorhizobium sp. R1-B TaxID=2485162 RepID=UPI00106506B1|nr:extracellular solute-binding protein [Neorhizobium sp. R1-B]TDX77718.1 microcin C transport system substrate-binding protein [Neorhizobium sp. R1-B]
MNLARLKVIFAVVLAVALVSSPVAAQEPIWRHGIALMGEPKLPADFKHFPYVNPDAPKGGVLNMSSSSTSMASAGTFDSFNPVLTLRGVPPAGLSQVFDTLMKSSEDEVSTSYGLIAESLSFPDDVSSVTFKLRPEAKWPDGEPITPEDVIFSFEKSKELNPRGAAYYQHVTGVEKTGDREVTFRFDEKNNRELPSILGQLVIVPKHWWEGTDASGKKRDISKTTLEPVMGSGAYKIDSFQAGSSIRYELRDDYWGKNLPVNVGQNNIRTINYIFYTDRDVEFEAFRSGATDFWQETQAARWATKYDFPAIKDGRVKKEEIPNPYRATGIMQALVPNLRRDLFKDQRIRRALNLALDFEEINRTVLYNQYTRVNSYFFGTELASAGLPEGRELEILNEIKDKVPASVFTTPYTNPVGGDPNKVRDNLRQAVALFKEAGWELKGNRMVHSKTGQPFAFEILLSSPQLERVALPYTQSLKKIGVEARVRPVDAAQYQNRTRSYDFDMTWVVWGQTLNPGNEQIYHWGSKSANEPGSDNYAGIADPGIDILINKIVFAKDRPELVAATKALDRVLLAHDYVVPLYYMMAMRIAYWDRFERPANLPEYGIGFPDAWWSKSAGK